MKVQKQKCLKIGNEQFLCSNGELEVSLVDGKVEKHHTCRMWIDGKKLLK